MWSHNGSGFSFGLSFINLFSIWVFLLHHLTHQKRVTTHFRCFITCHYDCQRSTSKEEIGHHKTRKQIWVLTDLGLSLSQLETM